jgi:hypothetical protein
MTEVEANSEFAACAKRMPRQKLRSAAAALLAVGAMFPALRVAAQQNGPPSSGASAAILFAPATLNPVSGFNPANGFLNGEGYGGDGKLANASTSQFFYPVGMAYDSDGNLFIADESNYIVRRIDHATGVLSTFAGTPQTTGFSPATGSAPATGAQLGAVAGLVVDSGNNVYVSDRSNDVVWKITSGGTISVFAGNGTGTCTGAGDALGDGCPATDATLDNPWALGIDAGNNIYIADSSDDLVRVVSSSTGKIGVFAGDVADAGSFGCNANLYSTSTGPYLATEAHLCFPDGVAFDGSGNGYISEATRDIVRIVNSSGYISTFAGTPGVRSYSGDGGPAIDASLDEPAGIYADPAGRVYISDYFNGEIRVVDSSGNINSAMGSTYGELNNYSIGEPDTQPVFINSAGEYSGAANGIYTFALDPYGNIVAEDSDGDAITSAGTTGQYDFGIQQAYTTTTTTSLNAESSIDPPYITISNPSGVTLTFTGEPTVTTITPSATPPAFAIAGGTCSFPGSLAAGASCTLVVGFTPTVGGVSGTPYTGTIVLDSNANSSPNTINLSGTGIGTGVCKYSASLTSSLSFTSPPNVTSATEAATLTNTGVCAIAVPTGDFLNNSPAGSAAFSLVSTNCPSTLNVEAACTFNIAFTPTALTSYSAQFELDIPNYGDIYSSLSGMGITAPAVSFNPTSLTFPTTSFGASALPMSTVLTNVGNASLTGVDITLAGADPGYFGFSGTNNCPTTLAAGASCTISVNFSPQTSITIYSAAISVADNASGSPQTVALIGTGAAGPAPVVINDSETIHTTDAPGVSLPVMILDAETIHTTDTPALNQSVLILDTENIHIVDAPAVKAIALPTTTKLTSSTATPVDGDPVVFTAKVSSTSATPDGEVSFYDGTAEVSTVALSGGKAIYSTSSLSVGRHSISAVYRGTVTFLTSTSNALVETVGKATPAITWPDPQAISYGTALGTHQLDATAKVGAKTIAGKFDYVPAAGTVLGAGMHTLLVAFTPTETMDYNKAAGSTRLVVNKANAALKLTLSAISAKFGSTVILTAKASAAGRGALPAGKVTFLSGTTSLGAVMLNGNGEARYSTAKLAVGKHAITASYAGNTDYSAGRSASLTITVSP